MAAFMPACRFSLCFLMCHFMRMRSFSHRIRQKRSHIREDKPDHRTADGLLGSGCIKVSVLRANLAESIKQLMNIKCYIETTR